MPSMYRTSAGLCVAACQRFGGSQPYDRADDAYRARPRPVARGSGGGSYRVGHAKRVMISARHDLRQYCSKLVTRLGRENTSYECARPFVNPLADNDRRSIDNLNRVPARQSRVPPPQTTTSCCGTREMSRARSRRCRRSTSCSTCRPVGDAVCRGTKFTARCSTWFRRRTSRSGRRRGGQCCAIQAGGLEDQVVLAEGLGERFARPLLGVRRRSPMRPLRHRLPRQR